MLDHAMQGMRPALRAHAPTAQERAWTELDRRVQFLLTGVSAGCQASFACLYDETSPGLMAIVLAVIPDRAAADDVVATLFIKLWTERASRPPTERRGLPWLATLARRTAAGAVPR